MTNKATMPEPVAWYHPSSDGYDSSFRDHSTILACSGNTWDGFLPLVTTDQAKAYADARVREALEAAEDAVTSLYEADDGPFLVEIARAICALIPQENKS